MALGGVVRDLAGHLAMQGWLGESLVSKATGYSVVFHLEIYLLFVVLVALGPLARRRSSTPVQHAPQPFGLAQMPG
jgi:BCD family chlorophyll transporter-like MFS transporter